MNDDFDWSERFKALRREIRELQEEIESIRKRKANGDDVEQIARKVSELESEVRAKFTSLQSANQEIRDGVRALIDAVNTLKNEVASQNAQVSSLKTEAQQTREQVKTSSLSRIPSWSWALMAIGLFAVLQLGLERWNEIQGVIR